MNARSQFKVCSKDLFSIQDVPREKPVSLRSAANKQPLGISQRFFNCVCTPKWITKRFLCRKNNVLYN